MTIFSKIINNEIPAKKIYEDDVCLAFHDVMPQAPVHVLLIPKITELAKLSDASLQHKDLLGHMMCHIPVIARNLGLQDYRVVINNGEQAGQSVFHLHIHILSGRPFSWPPG